MEQASPAGPDVRVEIRRSTRRKRTVTAYRERDVIVVLVPQRLGRAAERQVVDDLVQKVLAREARSTGPRSDGELHERATRLAATHLEPAVGYPIEPAAVRWVTNQQHRWGSCTPATGVIRLSHRLQPMPAWVVDYVIVHELAHLVEADHSRRFWALVDRYPEAERAKGFLEGYAAASAGSDDRAAADLGADQGSGAADVD